jgi:hypothetical protein
MTANPNAEQRFPGFDVLAQAEAWDDVTRAVVVDRVERVAPPCFFTTREVTTARALLDRLLALDTSPFVPVVELIDARLASREGDGYRYETMPDDGDAWRRSLAALDDEAQTTHGMPFAELAIVHQMSLLQAIQDGGADWHDLPASRLFALWLRYACAAFYSHPSAWNEIGFGGPAYPRGYKNVGIDKREPWEVEEVDARDPIPWVKRVEAARRRHERAAEQGQDA